MELHSLRPALEETERLLTYTLAEQGCNVHVVPVILSRGQKKARCLGWTADPATKGIGWLDGAGTGYIELALVAEGLNKPLPEILGVIIHEAVHVYAIAHDQKDTAKSGRHNKVFQELAESFGLIVHTRDDGKALDSYGFGYTSLSPELEARLFESFQPDDTAFGLYRQVTRTKTDGPPLWECGGCDPAQKGPHKGRPTPGKHLGEDKTGEPAFRAICTDCMTAFAPVVA